MKNTKNKQTRIIFALFIATSLLFLTISSSIQINADYPKQRIYHNMVYDSVNDVMVMYGGSIITGSEGRVWDTWTYDVDTNEWTRMITENTPYPSDTRMAYDSESDKVISFNGNYDDHVASDQTWVYDYTTNTWTQIATTTVPPIREYGQMEYDSESDVVILFGGGLHFDTNPDGITLRYNDTWAFDYNADTWTNITTATYPLNYQFSGTAYDSANDLVVLFGGSTDDDMYDDPTGGRYLGETWTFDYNTNTFTNVTPSVSPSPRIGHKMAYDSEHELTILFGGYTHLQPTEIDHETWAFDTNTMNWTKLNPDGDLEGRAQSMAYDSESEKIVLFGGNTGDDPYNFLDDTWVFDYDFNNWTKMPKPEVTPEPTLQFIFPVVISLSFLAVLMIIRRNST